MRAPLLVLLPVLAACSREAPKVLRIDSPEARSAPVVVSSATENGATPMFLTSATGARVVSWVSAPDGGADGVLNLSVTPPNGSEAFTTTIRDTLGPIEPHGEAPPQLAADSAGLLYALYAVGKEIPGQRFPVSALRLVRSEDMGRTWSAPVTVNGPGKLGAFGAHNFHALLALPDGRLVATWLLNDRGTSGVAMSRSSDYGRTWEPQRLVYKEPTCPCCRTAIAAGPDGSLYLAWRAIGAGDVRDVVVMRSPDRGETWLPPVKPREDNWVFNGCPHAGPSLKVDSAGTVHVAWWHGRAGEAGVYYAHSTDRGATFTSQPIAVAERSTPAHVQLALGSDGHVAVAWDDGHSALPRILLRRSRDGGRSFDTSVLLSDADAAASFPVLAVVQDSLCVAWSQTTEQAHREKLAKMVDMRDPKAVMKLPRVGQSEILMRMVGM